MARLRKERASWQEVSDKTDETLGPKERAQAIRKRTQAGYAPVTGRYPAIIAEPPAYKASSRLTWSLGFGRRLWGYARKICCVLAPKINLGIGVNLFRIN